MVAFPIESIIVFQNGSIFSRAKGHADNSSEFRPTPGVGSNSPLQVGLKELQVK